uniref:Uncharacterized protein n=1 Tax=uncultured Sphingobacteriia bacterium TaxID=246143 RepID=F4MM15_9BACT|nr:hypothetical protein S3_858_0007 [uncultured Sphingobacteriia bacterium]CBL87199.1 hypothetical protein S3_891_0011 [uncultured Sphingobacteriia bacterium]CBL87213.1 hypothetical protein S3_892_0005 [uncultured Sphingobacteriia bacterium]
MFLIFRVDKSNTMSMDLTTLKSRVNNYHEILGNIKSFRQDWEKTLKLMIIKTLEEAIKETKLSADIVIKDQVENLEAIVLDLGRTHSGMQEKVEDTDIKKTIIKTQGALVYQQLFNGKVMVMIVYPYIDGYGEPRPPKNLEILRPHELRQEYIIRHMEEFLNEVTQWEDYDDDLPEKSVIGFNKPIDSQQETLEN